MSAQDDLQSGYRYDIFLSYPSAEQVLFWVKSVFHPQLQGKLHVILGRPAEIFVDWEQPTGVRWRSQIVQALLRSKLFVAVWSPVYFTSKWCVAEWRSMALREDKLAKCVPPKPHNLIHPIIFAEGNFPEEAIGTQSKRDFKNWAYTGEYFLKSEKFLSFEDAVKTLAKELAEKLEEVPEWEDDWPLKDPPAITVDKPKNRVPKMMFR